MKTTRKIPHATASEAWAFMRHCDSMGVPAGFPSLDDSNTVEILATDEQARALGAAS